MYSIPLLGLSERKVSSVRKARFNYDTESWQYGCDSHPVRGAIARTRPAPPIVVLGTSISETCCGKTIPLMMLATVSKLTSGSPIQCMLMN